MIVQLQAVINFSIFSGTYDVQSVSCYSSTRWTGAELCICWGITSSNLYTDYLYDTRGWHEQIHCECVHQHAGRTLRKVDECQTLTLENVIRSVAEVERDGQVTTHRRRDILKLLVTELAPATTSTTTALINFFIVGYNKYAWVRIFCSTETTPNGRSYLQLFPVSENIGGIIGGIREGSYSIIMLYIQFFYLHTTIIQCHKLFLGTVTTIVMLLFNLLASL